MELTRAGRVNIILHWIAVVLLKLSGWRVEGSAPAEPKLVAIFAPHTCIWDAPLLVLMSFVLRVKGHWMAKDGAFFWPLGWIIRRLGAIPVERKHKHNTVESALAEFEKRDHIILALAPESTRGYLDHWKSGFYHIAVRAKIPIMPIFVDYERKTVGRAETFMPTGDVETDLATIRDIFAAYTPRYPELRAPVRFKE